MSWAAKLFFMQILAMICMSSNASEQKTLHILVIGQSISSNCNQYKFPASAHIDQITLTGTEVPAKDPMIWADCTGGSMWIPLGHALLTRHIADHVVFMPIGVAGTAIREWLPGGRAFPKLQTAMQLIHDHRIHFDFILWHQGSSDYGTSPLKYRESFLSLVRFVRKQGNLRASKWIIARHSGCVGRFDHAIWEAQNQLAVSDNNLNFFTGPDNNLLGAAWRFDGCHLNKAGQERMGILWADSIQQALSRSARLRRETLVDWFR